jgi:uncharacterized protein YkwD
VNHRRSPRGYHSQLAAGTLSVVLLAGCALVRVATTPGTVPSATPGQPWAAERALVVAQINAARAELGLDPLAYDWTLERVGDAHCMVLLEEGGDGHFSRSGVAPYLRYLLAGGRGFHRENIASYSSTAPVDGAQLGKVLCRSVSEMLDEVPPQDGHRRSLLDPWVTHIGVGLATQGGEVRMAHELATEVTEGWSGPPAVAMPRTAVALEGRLARPWRPAALEVLWEELPHPLTDGEARAIRSYGYPPRRAMFNANQPTDEPGAQARLALFTADRFGSFSFRWPTGPHEGVEIVLLWARYDNNRELVPVAASATVVTGTAGLPPELECWRTLRPGPNPP